MPVAGNPQTRMRAKDPTGNGCRARIGLRPFMLCVNRCKLEIRDARYGSEGPVVAGSLWSPTRARSSRQSDLGIVEVELRRLQFLDGAGQGCAPAGSTRCLARGDDPVAGLVEPPGRRDSAAPRRSTPRASVPALPGDDNVAWSQTGNGTVTHQVKPACHPSVGVGQEDSLHGQPSCLHAFMPSLMTWMTVQSRDVGDTSG